MRTSLAGLASHGAGELREIAWGQLKAEHGFPRPRIDLGVGISLGLRIQERLYTAGDDQITGCPLREATTRALEANGKTAFWLETGGIAELGGGMSGTLPLGVAGLGITGGFNVKGLIRYRTLRPYAFDKNALRATDLSRITAEVLKNSTFALPITPEAARRMQEGAEFELIGRGEFQLAAGLVLGPAAAMHIGAPDTGGPSISQPIGNTQGVSVGAGVNLSASGSLHGEFSVKVTNLDGDRLVRVAISTVKGIEGGLKLGAHAGLSINLAPRLGEGVISWLVNEDTGAATVDALVKSFEKPVEDYLSVSAELCDTISAAEQELESYIFDLSEPTARSAYQKMIRLQPGEARRLAPQPDGAVTRASANVHELSYSDTESIRAFGQKLLLRQAITTDTKARFVGPRGQSVSSQENIYQKSFSSLFLGTKVVRWSAVTLTPDEGEKPETFYSISVSAHDKITREAEVDAFFAFAHSVGADTTGAHRNLPKMNDIKACFSKRDDTEIKLELFFTPIGVHRIDEAKYAEAKMAFLETMQTLDTDLDRHPLLDKNIAAAARALFDEYVQTQTVGWLGRLCPPYGNSKVAEAYQQMTGRNIEHDFEIAQRAHEFGQRVEKFRCDQSAVQDNDFFVSIGKAKGFEYMGSIGALARLAGFDATLIHELSMTGGGVELVARNEGTIQHFTPSTEVLERLPSRLVDPTAPSVDDPVVVVSPPL